MTTEIKEQKTATDFRKSEAQEKKSPCFHCHTNNPELEYLIYDGKNLCRDCYDDQVISCGECHEAFWQEQMTCINEKYYCERCAVDLFRYCSNCEKYVGRERAYYSEIHDADYCEACFNDFVTYCVSCDNQIDPQNCQTGDNGDCFCEDCWEHRDEETNQNEYPERLGESFIRCCSKRKYGIEIEALLDDGKNHLSQNRFRQSFPGWNQVPDGSLGEDGREYTSPILQGDEGFKEIEGFSSQLRDWGYFIKQECGLHVHIDGRDLRCEDIKKLLKMTCYFEPILYAMLPSSRYKGTYSVPLEKFPKSRFRIKVGDEQALKRLWYGRRGERENLKTKYHHSRYYGLNVHSWFFRRSLEFRYHSGTLNPLKITNFIMVCQALVDKAKDIKRFVMPAPLNFCSHFENFASFLNLSPALVFYTKQRIMKFHPERFLDAVIPAQA